MTSSITNITNEMLFKYLLMFIILLLALTDCCHEHRALFPHETMRNSYYRLSSREPSVSIITTSMHLVSARLILSTHFYYIFCTILLLLHHCSIIILIIIVIKLCHHNNLFASLLFICGFYTHLIHVSLCL